MVEGALWQYNQIPYLPGGGGGTVKHKVASNHIGEVLPQDFWVHLGLPSLRAWHQEEQHPERLALKTSMAWVQDLHKTSRERDPTLDGRTQAFMYAGTQHKAVTPRGLGWTQL